MKKLICTLRATLFLLAALLLMSGISAEAQTFRGTILGTVMDSSGLPVTGATVAGKNRETGLARTTQTSEDGSYTVTELPIGTYTVTISQSGFQTSVTSDVVVNVAIPPADVVPVPSTVAPSRNVTVSPAGAPDDPATEAISVTSWPESTGFGVAASVVVVIC